jgi:DNA-binding Lrp family transcriptional regulator
VITTIVLIRAEPASIPATAQYLADIDGVSDVYSVSGDWDLVAIVKVAEYDQIARVVTEAFPKCPGLQRTQTLTAFRGVGHRGRVAALSAWTGASRRRTSCWRPARSRATVHR